MKIGFIFECGREGADVQVCRHFVRMLNPAIEFVPRTLDNKKKLAEDCGPVAKLLLMECKKVVIVWDLYPAWREKGIKPCRREDRNAIIASLKAHHVPLNKVGLVCIEEELEAWLLADERALQTVISRLKAPHPAGRISCSKNPDSIKNPKTRLTRLFNQELGRARRYEDRRDAILIARAINDFSRMRRSETFCRFAMKVAGVDL